jgi:holo-[acyl-carrier protein] synthase
MLRTGVDLIEIDRIRHAVERHGAHLLQRIYTAEELAVCQGRIESLAARFAAKEAVAKALGTGIWRHGITWTDIQVTRDHNTGAPLLHLDHAAASRAATLHLHTWSLSLSHDRTHAVAFVVAMS